MQLRARVPRGSRRRTDGAARRSSAATAGARGPAARGRSAALGGAAPRRLGCARRLTAQDGAPQVWPSVLAGGPGPRRRHTCAPPPLWPAARRPPGPPARSLPRALCSKAGPGPGSPACCFRPGPLRSGPLGRGRGPRGPLASRQEGAIVLKLIQRFVHVPSRPSAMESLEGTKYGDESQQGPRGVVGGPAQTKTL